MDMTNQEYGRYVSQKAKPSPLWKNLLWAFVTGGLICTRGTRTPQAPPCR